jgi:hypothetical protein
VISQRREALLQSAAEAASATQPAPTVPQSPPHTHPLPAGLTIPGAVAYSGLARTRLYNEAAAGRLTFRRAGKRTLILRAELDALLASLPVAPIRKTAA